MSFIDWETELRLKPTEEALVVSIRMDSIEGEHKVLKVSFTRMSSICRETKLKTRA